MSVQSSQYIRAWVAEEECCTATGTASVEDAVRQELGHVDQSRIRFAEIMAMPDCEYNIVLLEKPLDEGLSMEEVIHMHFMLSGCNAIPIEIQGEFSTAMGFINLTDAEFMNYDYSELEEFVKSVLGNTDKENPDCKYEVENGCGVSTVWLGRNLPQIA